ncbi:hypothetical protein BS78_02G359100 [Paspalum vaginatum]|nr:hypothetical protein BS78_02G359100 [Paspalum vaginatum]
MPHRQHGDEAPSPRPSAGGCYAFLTARPHHRASSSSGGCRYRRLDSAALAPGDGDAGKAAVRVEVGTARGRAKKSVFHVEPAVLEAGPVRRLLAAAGRRAPGGGVAVAVDALLFEHLLWLARDGVGMGGGDDDLSEIVEFYAQDDDDDAIEF